MCAGWQEYRRQGGETDQDSHAERVRKLGLLVVDDEGDIVDSLGELFHEHFDIYRAQGGEQALQMFREHGPKLVITDQRMPQMSGIDLLRQIKGIAPEVVAVLVTGYSDIDVVIEALNEGLVWKYITKPWDHAQLRSLVLSAACRYLGEQDGDDSRYRSLRVIGC